MKPNTVRNILVLEDRYHVSDSFNVREYMETYRYKVVTHCVNHFSDTFIDTFPTHFSLIIIDLWPIEKADMYLTFIRRLRLKTLNHTPIVIISNLADLADHDDFMKFSAQMMGYGKLHIYKMLDVKWILENDLPGRPLRGPMGTAMT